MKKFIKIAILAVSVLTLNSCKKDKENPTITIIEPTNHEEFLWGAEMHVEATFEDDRDLKSYHVYIGTEAGVLTPEFDVEFQGDITGKTFDFHEHVVVPDSVDAVYYLHFEVTDAENKVTTQQLMLHFME